MAKRLKKDMLFKWLKNRAEKRQRAENIYWLTANHARHPLFFQDYQVPDSMTGRYELLCIHVYLLLERLRREEDCRDLSQQITEILVKEIERAYRDSGFQDLSIPKNVKKLIAGFYERTEAYKTGIRRNNVELLVHAVNKFVYADQSDVNNHAPKLSIYMLAAYNHLNLLPISEIETANFAFISPDMESA